MTKREDPQWGSTEAVALEAARATFHFTNCVPQVGELNTQEWGKLETFILEKTSVPDNLKVCVLTGPVLAEEDPEFVTEVDGETVQLPTLFWKVVYYTEDGKNLSRAGFLMGQENILFDKGMAIRKVRPAAERLAIHDRLFQDFEDAAIYQVNIQTIEQLSRLTFSPALEPYHDDRPLKLIVKKVQLPSTADARQQLSVIEETDQKVEFSNIRLKTSTASPAASKAELQRIQPVSEAAAHVASISSSNGPEQQYTTEMKKHFGYYAAWVPSMPLKLGDVGILRGNTFNRISNIEQLHVPVKPTVVAGNPIDLKYASEGSVSITTKLSGTIPPQGSTLTQTDAGIVVEFHKDKSVCFQANQCVTTIIDDTVDLGNKVLSLYKEGKWDKNWVVITELMAAGSASILIANKAGAKIELKANANITAPKLDIADAHFEFSAGFTHDIATEMIARQGLTPLLKVMGIKTSWFSDPVFRTQSVKPFELLTPSSLYDPERKDKISFGLISDEIHE